MTIEDKVTFLETERLFLCYFTEVAVNVNGSSITMALLGFHGAGLKSTTQVQTLVKNTI